MAKILLSQIQEEAEGLSWKILSDSYKNLKELMEWECPKGHKVLLPYGKWRQSHICPVCEEKEKNSLSAGSPKPKNSYRILALDQATYTTGWAIYQDQTLLNHGCFSVSYNNEANRINEIRNWVLNIITAWQIDFVCIEDIQLQDHKEAGARGAEIGVTTYKSLAHLQGVLINLLFSHSIPYTIAPPGVWRKYCGIKGKGRDDKKKSAQLKVKEWYGELCSLDEAEAICIGKYAIADYGKKTEMLEWG